MQRLTSRHGIAGLAAAALLCTVAPGWAQPAAETPSQVATRFLLSFEKQDFPAVRSLFAPGALVSSVSYSKDGAAHAEQSPAGAWLDLASTEMAHVEEFKIDILKTSELSFAEGATVSIRFHASGRAGGAFNVEGIDTYSMVRIDGAWRILQYSYIERLQSAPRSAAADPRGR